MRRSASMSSSLVAVLCLYIVVYVMPSAGQATPAGAPSSACQTELFSLAPCLGFLTNNSISTVAPNCCSALTNVSAASPTCLCSFLDPSNINQGIALGVNQTRALQLPTICGLTLSPSECADLAPVGAPAPSPVAGGPVPSSPPTSVPSPGVTTPANSPAANCPAVMNSLAPCLTYLESSVSTPSAPCCESLKAATAQPECLCEIIQSPPSGVNTTAALNLPALCDVSVLSLSTCSASSPGGQGPTAGSPNNGSGSLLMNGAGLSPSLLILATMTVTILMNGINLRLFA